MKKSSMDNFIFCAVETIRFHLEFDCVLDMIR